MTRIAVVPASFADIAAQHERRRGEARCQIVRDSILPRGLADPYLVTRDGVAIGYGGVWNEHFRGRVMDFHLERPHRRAAAEAFRTLLSVSGAGALEAQTNLPVMHAMLERFGGPASVEHLLFGARGDAARWAGLKPPDGGVFRRRRPDETGPEGDWVVARDDEVVAAGGILTHYNPPFADLYMSVREDARGRGLGSYLVQELARVCREGGQVPAARCDPGNEASRRALTRGGLVECGRLLVARVAGRPD